MSLCLCSLLALSCGDLMLFRSSGDYFPLVEGSEWKYLVGNDTTYTEVTGDSSIGNRPCIVVDIDFIPEFWYREPTQLRKFFRRTVSRGGYEYTLEERYGLVYVLPFVLGNSWRETFQDTVVLLGTDTVHYYHRLEARVSEIAEVNTPAGSFGQCYRLDFTEEIRALDTTITQYTEWLAPGVGVVKRRLPSGDEELAAYRIGP